jgi:hypothetical protein
VDPKTMSCTDETEATGVGFKFLGGTIFCNLVWIVVSGGRTGDVYSSAVGLNHFFHVEGDFRGEVAIEISTVDEDGGGPEQLLERLDIDTACAEDDTILRLTAIFGPLKLNVFQERIRSIHKCFQCTVVLQVSEQSLNCSRMVLSSPVILAMVRSTRLSIANISRRKLLSLSTRDEAD